MTVKVKYPFGGHSVFHTVLANMFRVFKESVEAGGINDNERRGTLMIFQKTFDAANVCSGHKNESYDPLEALIELSSATDIESHFRELFKATGYTVDIQVDDFYSLNDYEAKDIGRIKIWQS
jgi:hypothetical protein